MNYAVNKPLPYLLRPAQPCWTRCGLAGGWRPTFSSIGFGVCAALRGSLIAPGVEGG